MEKSFKQKLLRIKFTIKKSVGTYVYLPQEWSKGARKTDWLKYYDAQKWQITFTLWLDTEKNTAYMEKSFK